MDGDRVLEDAERKRMVEGLGVPPPADHPEFRDLHRRMKRALKCSGWNVQHQEYVLGKQRGLDALRAAVACLE